MAKKTNTKGTFTKIWLLTTEQMITLYKTDSDEIYCDNQEYFWVSETEEERDG